MIILYALFPKKIFLGPGNINIGENDILVTPSKVKNKTDPYIYILSGQNNIKIN